MPEHIAQQFMKSLQEIERSKDVEPLVRLFADDAELHSLVEHRDHRGPDGARDFWKEYLGSFQEVRSDFKRVHEGDGFAVLEWESRGKLKTGRELTYQGVSVVEADGDKVKRFKTYYDSAPFVAPTV